MKVVILTPHMTEKKDDASEISEVGTEEKKNFKGSFKNNKGRI